MADNIPITSGAGLTVATDEDGGGLQHQWIKIKFGGDGSFTAVTTLAGLPVQILSLPDLGLNSSVKITSLPSFAVGSIVSVSGLTSAIVSISNLPLQVSGTTIAITSLPDLGLGSSVKITSLPNFAVGSILSVSGLTSAVVSISNLPLQVSGTTIAITSLPDLGLGSSVKITSLPAFAAGSIVSVSNGTTVIVGKPTSYWSYTATFTSAQTNAVLIALPGSTTALHLTDIIFSNSSTQGSLSLIESRSNAAIREKIAPIFLYINGGAVSNFVTPIVLDTNAALCLTSRSVTAHSVTVVGYTL